MDILPSVPCTAKGLQYSFPWIVPFEPLPMPGLRVQQSPKSDLRLIRGDISCKEQIAPGRVGYRRTRDSIQRGIREIEDLKYNIDDPHDDMTEKTTSCTYKAGCGLLTRSILHPSGIQRYHSPFLPRARHKSMISKFRTSSLVLYRSIVFAANRLQEMSSGSAGVEPQLLALARHPNIFTIKVRLSIGW